MCLQWALYVRGVSVGPRVIRGCSCVYLDTVGMDAGGVT